MVSTVDSIAANFVHFGVPGVVSRKADISSYTCVLEEGHKRNLNCPGIQFITGPNALATTEAEYIILLSQYAFVMGSSRCSQKAVFWDHNQ